MLVSDHIFVMIDSGKWDLGLIGGESGNFEEFGLNFVVVASVQTSERHQRLHEKLHVRLGVVPIAEEEFYLHASFNIRYNEKKIILKLDFGFGNRYSNRASFIHEQFVSSNLMIFKV